MLDIAESVFQIIAERLKELKLNVKKTFGKKTVVLDSFEEEVNVQIIQAKDFLDTLKVIGVESLSELEVACLMRVLSKPEIEHGILLNELNMVLENFGIEVGQEDVEVVKEKAENKKQKLNKKKMIANAV
jgi:hypothetical protein